MCETKHATATSIGNALYEKERKEQGSALKGRAEEFYQERRDKELGDIIHIKIQKHYDCISELGELLKTWETLPEHLKRVIGPAMVHFVMSTNL